MQEALYHYMVARKTSYISVITIAKGMKSQRLRLVGLFHSWSCLLESLGSIRSKSNLCWLGVWKLNIVAIWLVLCCLCQMTSPSHTIDGD